MMFEPNEDEARRAEALQQAVMSSSADSQFNSTSLFTGGTRKILDRAHAFEEWLKNGTEVNINQDMPMPQPKGAFGQYQNGGLDAGS